MKIPRSLASLFFSLPWIATAAAFGWILLERFPPSGTFVAVTALDGRSAFINPFLPSERTTVPGVQADGWVGQRITGDPVYFTSRIPGPYEHATVELEFRSIRQPLLEFGIVRDEAGGQLDLRPMYASELQAKAWSKAPGGYVQQGTPPRRLRDPDTRGLAVWNASTSMPVMQDPVGPLVETAVSLRGAHDFYIVPSAGSLDIRFDVQDANRREGSTVVAVRLFRGDVELQRDVLQTNASRETSMGTVFEHRVTLGEAPPGVYRIVFQMSDDVFIRAVRTTSKRWVVGPRLNVGDVVGYAASARPVMAWTDSRHLVMETLHAEGLQTVEFGAERGTLRRTHEVYRLDRQDDENKPARLFAPRGDVKFIGDGFFALRDGAFFSPKPKRLTDAMELEREGIVGVLTSYERPTATLDGWLHATQTFALDPSQDRLRFVLSAPGIMSRAGAVDIRRITITYRRAPLNLREWGNLLLLEAKNAWRRL